LSRDPWDNDPSRWGASLINVAEILLAFLDAIAARSVVEIGAYRGELTQELLEWAAPRDARVAAVEPTPPPHLLELKERHPELELIAETSHEVLRHLSLPDALIIDGDHNYYTLSEELRLIDERAPGSDLPLLMFHDLCWPHARRDTYFAPDRIPAEHRQPLAEGAGLVPDEPGVIEGGLPFQWAAEREGGPRNGLLTAVEDFIAQRDGLRLAVVPVFFGLGVLWHEDAAWGDALADAVEPWDRHPVLERLEENRVFHLAMEHVQFTQAMRLRERTGHQEHLLREMLGSRAFALAERLSRLRQRGRPRFSREQVRRVLGEDRDRS
jgi:hypothetical protein